MADTTVSNDILNNHKRFRLLQWGNGIAFLAMVAVNALAVLLPINGITPGEVSDSYPNLFAPAAMTFSIWSVIYLMLFLFVLFQAGLFTMRSPEKLMVVNRIGILFILSSLFNIAWIFCWHYKQIALSLCCIVALLCMLILIHGRINQKKLSWRECAMVRIPFSVYFGWITVATIANVSTLLVSLDWDGFGMSDEFWTILVLIVGMVIGLLVIMPKRDPVYGLAMAWAYLGIVIKHSSTTGFDMAYPSVTWIAGIAGGVLIVASVVALVFGKRWAKTEEDAES